jgi:hypothetical protein
LKKLTVILAVILVLLVAERVLFNTSKVNVDIEPPYLRASTSSALNIKVYPVNMLGFKNLFGRLDVRFEIEEGGNLVELSEPSGNSVGVRSRGIEGEAVIGIYSLRSGVQVSRVLIKILPVDKA